MKEGIRYGKSRVRYANLGRHPEKLQVPKGSSFVPSTTSTTSVPCDGGNVGKQEQESRVEKGKPCYLEGQDVCNMIWKSADQGMKTWIRVKASRSSKRRSSPGQSTTSTTSVPCAGGNVGKSGPEKEVINSKNGNKKTQDRVVVKDKAYYRNIRLTRGQNTVNMISKKMEPHRFGFALMLGSAL